MVNPYYAGYAVYNQTYEGFNAHFLANGPYNEEQLNLDRYQTFTDRLTTVLAIQNIPVHQRDP